MKVWFNKYLSGHENDWEIGGSRYLKLVNKTGRHGKMLDGVFLGHKRINRTHIIFVNQHRAGKAPIQKECGVWVSESDYNIIGNVIFTGKTKSINNAGIAGRFGIYNIGAIIECDGRVWELKKGKGWVIIQVLSRDNYMKQRERTVNEAQDLC